LREVLAPPAPAPGAAETSRAADATPAHPVASGEPATAPLSTSAVAPVAPDATAEASAWTTWPSSGIGSVGSGAAAATAASGGDAVAADAAVGDHCGGGESAALAKSHAGLQSQAPVAVVAALPAPLAYVSQAPLHIASTPNAAAASQLAALPMSLPSAAASSAPTPPTTPLSNCATAAPATPAAEVTASAALFGTQVSSQPSSGLPAGMGAAASAGRNAKAVKYVDTLLGRANREKIPEEDARQANEYFEAAKSANATEDYKSACSYFETSFLLNPKLTTLISTANMHLKLRNPTVASEIYMRLLQNPSVPQREREVALRKLAVCETMLGTASDADAPAP